MSSKGASRLVTLALAFVLMQSSVSATQATGQATGQAAGGIEINRRAASALSGSITDDLVKLQPPEDQIERGHYQAAIPDLKQYLGAHPASARAHYDLGYADFRTHDIAGAVRELSKSLELDGSNAQAHKILGLVCTFVGRYDLAEVEMQRAAALEPASAEIHYWLGRIYYTREVYPLAVKQFQDAVRLDGSDAKAYTNLGLVLEAMGKDADALADYNKAIEIDEQRRESSPWPYEYLSAHYVRQHDSAHAIEYAGKALAADSHCDLAYYDIARAYQIERNWQRSADAVEKAIAINANTPEYFYVLSVALRGLGKNAQSDAALKRFQEIHQKQNATARMFQKADRQPGLHESPPGASQ